MLLLTVFDTVARASMGTRGTKGHRAHKNGAKDAFTKSSEQSELEAAFEKSWIPLLEGQLQENPWQESSIYLWMISVEQVEQRVLTRPKNISKFGRKIGTMLPLQQGRQRIRWTQDSQNGPSVEVSQ